MSLINQVLKDLDKSRGPVTEAHVSALQGMGLINVNRFTWHKGLPITAWGLTVLLAIVLCYQASIWWNTNSHPQATLPAQTVVEIDEFKRHEQPDTASTPDILETVPLDTFDEDAEAAEEPSPIALATPAEPVQTMVQPAAEPFSKPVNLLTPEQKADRLFARAQQALYRHQQQTGEELLKQALDEYSRHIGARSQLAALQLSRQQADEAEQLLAEGLLTDPHQLALARPYAQLLAARNELVPALRALDAAIDRSRADPETLALRAAMLYRMGRHTESAVDYQLALQAQPNQALWWTGLAVALEQNGRSAQALVAYQRAATQPLDKPVYDYVRQRMQALRDVDFSH